MALMVGVSGVRGLVGQTLTPELVCGFAQAYGTMLKGGRVVLARDSRPSGEMYGAAAAAGLLSAGCDVTRLGIAMTPTVGYAIRTGGFKGGMSITASHNPAQWNGLKFLDNEGLAPDPAIAAEIKTIYDNRAFNTARSGFSPMVIDDQAGQRHAHAVKKLIEVDLAPLKGAKVVLDCVNGAGGVVTPTFLRELRLDVDVMNGEPNGLFAHEPEPIESNLRTVADRVRAVGAAVGFCQDPDADRLALIDEKGAFIGEEYTLALSTWSVLSRNPGPVAANLSTSRLIDAIAEKYCVTVTRTPVGEANVARAMIREKCVVGGEGNGGVIDPRVCLVRDSLSAMSLTLQLMAQTGQSVSELVAALPRFAMIKQKFECPREKIQVAATAVAQKFANERVNQSDGTRVDFAEGWVHLRASNTEPIVRIMAEAEDDKVAHALIERVHAAAGL
ncbi:MAG: phosphoglucosamine mutase [Phycisphaerales bacterium]|nr:phosphoglucosamine mutase [Phycisphaerales bacterium]